MNSLTSTRITGGLGFVVLFLIGIAMAYVSLVRQTPLPAIAVVYCSFFMFLVWTRPQIALTGIIAVTPFVQDLGVGLPIKFSLAEIHLLLAFVVYVVKGVLTRSIRFVGPLSLPVTIYLVVLIWTSLRSGLELEDIKALVQTFVTCGVTVAVFANMVPDAESMVRSFILLPIFCLPIAVLEITTGSYSVFGLHKNSIGGSMAAGVIVLANLWYSQIEFSGKRYVVWLLMLIGGGLLISLSRGAWIGTMIGITVSGLLWGRITLVFRTLIVAIPVLLVLWFLLPSEKREYATGFQADRWNIKTRIETQENLQEIFTKEPIFGVGIGLRKQVDATNFVLVTLAESGVVGLVAIIGVFGTIVRVGFRLCRSDTKKSLVLCGSLAVGLLACKVGHGMVDHFWGRGNGTVVWASIGVLLAAERKVVARRRNRLQLSERMEISTQC
jgi:O-antigen ligase